MILIFGRSISPSLSRYFAERAAEEGHQVKFASMGEFPDEEPFAELEFDPAGELCVIFQSMAHSGGFGPSSHYMQMLTCADNLKRNGAARVWAVTPFGAFMRQDKLRPGRRESLLSDLSPRLMREAGIDGMSTVEAHSQEALDNYEAGLGKGAVLNINPNHVFARAIQRLGLNVRSVANPDMGADARSKDLAAKLGIGERFSIDKHRSREGTEIIGQEGDVKTGTALIDDMASTLGTAKNAIELLYDEGSQQNYLLISHPIMTGQAWDNLAKLIKKGKLDRVLFLTPFSRDEEFARFKQQYGPDIADRIVFLEDEFNAMMYDHVMGEVANHPVMRMGEP